MGTQETLPNRESEAETGKEVQGLFSYSCVQKKKTEKTFPTLLLSLQSKKEKRKNNTGTPEQVSQLTALC